MGNELSPARIALWQHFSRDIVPGFRRQYLADAEYKDKAQGALFRALELTNGLLMEGTLTPEVVAVHYHAPAKVIDGTGMSGFVATLARAIEKGDDVEHTPFPPFGIPLTGRANHMINASEKGKPFRSFVIGWDEKLDRTRPELYAFDHPTPTLAVGNDAFTVRYLRSIIDSCRQTNPARGPVRIAIMTPEAYGQQFIGVIDPRDTLVFHEQRQKPGALLTRLARDSGFPTILFVHRMDYADGLYPRAGAWLTNELYNLTTQSGARVHIFATIPHRAFAQAFGEGQRSSMRSLIDVFGTKGTILSGAAPTGSLPHSAPYHMDKTLAALMPSQYVQFSDRWWQRGMTPAHWVLRDPKNDNL